MVVVWATSLVVLEHNGGGRVRVVCSHWPLWASTPNLPAHRPGDCARPQCETLPVCLRDEGTAGPIFVNMCR
eukprot:9418415-Alexandrium_andersonii.AAC.1